MTDSLAKLLDAAPADPDAARELAELVRKALAQPDRRVGAAFKIKRRGGEPAWRTTWREKRDEALCALDLMLDPAMTPEQRAREIMKSVDRHLATANRLQDSNNRRRQLLEQITDMADDGLPVPGFRQIKNILARTRK